jgi:hypothetical protein
MGFSGEGTMKIGRNSELLSSALEYLDAGYSIIPVGQDKKPLIKWEEYQKRQATREEVKEWWTRHPGANIGMVTGNISGICAVDNDDPNSKHQLLKTIDEFAQPPVSMTPRGGNHMIFGMPDKDIRNTVNFLEKVDFRGEGGYIVVPPSMNGNGKGYTWKRSLLTTDIPTLPDSIIKLIQSNNGAAKFTGGPFTNTNINTNIKNITNIGDSNDPIKQDAISTSTVSLPPKKSCDKAVTSPVTSCDTNSDSVTSCDKIQAAVTSCDIFRHGQRDENLFHIANCLSQTKNDDVYIASVLRAIVASWGEKDEKWIWTKVGSAMNRAMRRERNIQQEVDSFIATTSGHFQVSACYGELQILSKQDKAAVRKALARRLGQTIEKYGNKDGVYRRIDTDVEYIDFTEEEGALSAVQLPLRLCEMIELCEGNIVLCSGEYNAGKTGFCLNTLQMNKNTIRIRYISSEMKAGEFKKRWRNFGLPYDFWLPDEMTDYVKLNNNLCSLIIPDALNIIDYMEFKDGDYTQGAEYLAQIHDKLTTGVAIVAIQHKEGSRLPRAGDLVMEKPRLAITFRKTATDTDIIAGSCEILKAKNIRKGKCDGKKLMFEIVEGGSRFKITNDWGYYR